MRDPLCYTTRASGDRDLLPIPRQSVSYITQGEWWSICWRANQAFIEPKKRVERVCCHKNMNTWCAALGSLVVTTGISVSELLRVNPMFVLAPDVELNGDVWRWVERLLRRRARIGLRGRDHRLFCFMGKQIGLPVTYQGAERKLKTWARILRAGHLTWGMLRRADEGTKVLRYRLPETDRTRLLRLAGISDG